MIVDRTLCNLVRRSSLAVSVQRAGWRQRKLRSRRDPRRSHPQSSEHKPRFVWTVRFRFAVQLQALS